MKPLYALIFAALHVLCTASSAQNAVTTPEPPPCPEPTELQAEHLYGLWRAEFTDTPQAQVLHATLLFERHPEFAGSVSGAIRRDSGKALVSGDADEGVFTLEESEDGHNISATWTGTVVPQACGREIRGTWTDVLHPATREFVLRKVPGGH